MKQVIIGFDKDGKPYVVSAPKKIEVIFREPQLTGKNLKRIWRQFSYRLKTLGAK